MYLAIKELIPFDTDGAISFIQTRLHLVLSEKGRYSFPPRTIDGAALSNADLDTQRDTLAKFYGLTGYFIFTSFLWDTNRLLVEWQEHDIVLDTAVKQWRVISTTRSHTFSFGEDPRFELFSIGKNYFLKAKLPEGKSHGATYEFIVCKTAPIITG